MSKRTLNVDSSCGSNLLVVPIKVGPYFLHQFTKSDLKGDLDGAIKISRDCRLIIQGRIMLKSKVKQ